MFEITVLVEAPDDASVDPLVDAIKRVMCPQWEVDHPGPCPYPWAIVTSRLEGEDAVDARELLGG